MRAAESRSPSCHENATANRLLAALSVADRDALMRRMEPVAITAGQVVYQRGRAMSHAWFPLDCIVCFQQTAESGAEAEVSYIGREGFVGVPLFMGGRVATGAAVAVTGGTCLRVGAQVLRQQARHSMAMERLFLRYAQALFFQTAQLALCRHIHGALARTCSCLLFSSDRLESAESFLTMPLLSRILRFEPAEVGAVLRQIQESAAIDCRGGTVKILKRQWLLGHACECYALTEKEYRHLVPQHRPAGISPESVRGRVHEDA